MLASANPAKASSGLRSQARCANQPATNADAMKPMTNPKLGLATAAIEPVKSAKTGRPGEPDEHVGRQGRSTAPGAESSADDDDPERLTRDRHRPQRDRDLGEQRDDRGAGDDESGVEREGLRARGRAGDEVGENGAVSGGGGGCGERGHGAPRTSLASGEAGVEICACCRDLY